MKTSLLRQGMHVRRKGEPDAPVLTFVTRALHAAGYCTLQCDKYCGQNGPDDKGIVHVSNWDMSRKYELCGREG